MTLTLTLPPDVERRLLERAAQTGRDARDVAGEMIARGLAGPARLDDILAPFRAEVAASGLSDDDLDAVFEEQRDDARRDRAGGR